jgi:glycosyltransferase involved in cell wall biosynthesis
MDISIVISLFNEEESLGELLDWITKVVEDNNYSYEIILIDDGSTDNSWRVIEEYSKRKDTIRAIRFRRNYGKSAALYCGFEAAQGNVVITMDADLQDSPEEIPGLFNEIVNNDYDLVSGWKKKRYDPLLSKNLPSKLFNFTARLSSGIKLHDFNCGLKAYRKDVVKNIEVYGEMHRYIPVIAKQSGFPKISERVVQHQKRKYGKSKFGMNRFINGFLDLLTLSFISKFGKKPMHFFGLWGSVSFILGFLILAYLSFLKIAYHEYKMTERPLFYLGFLAVIFGAQLFLTGFMAELISRNASERNLYNIEKRIR